MLETLLTSKEQGATVVFLAPTLKQAKDNTEGYLASLLDGFPKDRMRSNLSEGKYTFLMNNGDRRRFITKGSESEIRGVHPEMLVIDEAADIPVPFFSTDVMGMIGKNTKAILMGTPKGHRGALYHTYDMAKNKVGGWGCRVLKASETGILSLDTLFELRQSMTEAEYSQEYECDFEADVLVGSVYGDVFKNHANANIDDSYGYDPTLPVFTSWDLGWDDYVAVWFFQVKNDRITFIDYLEDGNQYPAYYAELLRKKPYNYHTAILPFDGFLHRMEGPPVGEQLRKFGIRSAMAPKESPQVGIEKAREYLRVARFSESRCELGISRLRNLRYKVNKMGIKQRDVEHDENSHGSDAFRYFAVSKSIWGKEGPVSCMVPD
jgi:hypothetical protein